MLTFLLISQNVFAQLDGKCIKNVVSVYVDFRNDLDNGFKYHDFNKLKNDFVSKGMSLELANAKAKRYFARMDEYQKSVTSVKGVYVYCNDEKTVVYLEIVNNEKYLLGDTLFFEINSENKISTVSFEYLVDVKESRELGAFKYKKIENVNFN